MVSANKENISYWATLQHYRTWIGSGDKLLLEQVINNGSLLSQEIGSKIARQYRVSRSFRGIAQIGYDGVLAIVNAVPVGPSLSFGERVDNAANATLRIKQEFGWVNPSAVSKWMWFRQPDNWYMYDSYTAEAVGAARASVRGMRTFNGVLYAAGVENLNREITELVRHSAFPDLRAERIIDKALWLMGGSNAGSLDLAQIAAENLNMALEPSLDELARRVNSVLRYDAFELLGRN